MTASPSLPSGIVCPGRVSAQRKAEASASRKLPAIVYGRFRKPALPALETLARYPPCFQMILLFSGFSLPLSPPPFTDPPPCENLSMQTGPLPIKAPVFRSVVCQTFSGPTPR